ncbi:hypothetical protein N7462_010221 [Penicillium macrosclerotiorum]|uniref:uncharacterized protein n=1 Tax=Penicillium macrosclerotiorum TaxID=303699 RepID=UPI0025481B96|nr:uncharacterized protein N7462_010221 [Penicillium macrosclerotiorum]KAJ5669151.1 hypothetical protein N7462_010221 [Penicillium macrosclerotiorum]
MEVPAKLPFSKRRLRPRVVISWVFPSLPREMWRPLTFALSNQLHLRLCDPHLCDRNSVCVIGFWVLDSIEPYHQHFSLENKSLQYPYAVHERIPIVYALCISGLFPLVLIIVYTLFIDGLFSHHKPQDLSGKRRTRGPWRWKDRLWEMNCGILGLLLSQGLAFVVTQVLKNACGKPRPDLIDRCQPRGGSHDLSPYGLSNSTICTGQASLIKDGFRSWPSGHSSCESSLEAASPFPTPHPPHSWVSLPHSTDTDTDKYMVKIASFAGLFYTSLWLGGKLHIMDNRGETWKTLLCTIPILAATLVAVSRIMDARHHPFDVITGSLLGVACAIVSYRQYFPPLSEAWRKGRAYPIRTWGTEPPRPVGGQLTALRSNSTKHLRNSEEDRLQPSDDHERSVSPSSRAGPGFTGHTDPTNPFTSQVYPRRPHDHDPDGNWSSSEDGSGDAFEMQRGFDMQQGYAMPRDSSVSRYSVPHQTNTAYQSQAYPAASARVPPPPEVVLNHERGRQLSETPLPI